MKYSQPRLRMLVAAGTLVLALATAGTRSASASQVFLNGQALKTTVSPLQRNGRVLVPMRDIFEALGAAVQWNAVANSITAQQGTSTVNMQIGNRLAMVNGQRIFLEQ